MGAFQGQARISRDVRFARPEHELEGAVLLRDVGRGVAGLRVLDEVTAERILGLQVVGDRRPVPERLGHLDPVAGAVEGEGGTADDLHVPEPQGGQVVRGHLAAHRQGARAVQDRAGEPLDRRLHRLQRRRVPVQRELRPAGEHQERDREPLEELGGAQQLPLELRPEGIGQRQDEPVVLIVDLRGHTGVDAVVVRIHDRVRRREQLVGRRTVDQVPAVVPSRFRSRVRKGSTTSKGVLPSLIR